MNLQQALAWRNGIGKLGMLFCLLASLAVLDGVVAKFFDPTNVFHLLPGDEAAVNGPLPENIKKTEELTFTSDSSHLTVVFDSIHSGYFLGGNMWRGRLLVAPGAAPGKYVVNVRPLDYPPEKPAYQLRVVIHPDPISQRQGFHSLLKRRTGRSPYFFALLLLPGIVLSWGAVWLLSRRLEVLEAAAGLAEIYHVNHQEGVYRLTFGLGQRHGLQVGDRVAVLDPRGNYVGTGQVIEAAASDATAAAAIEQKIRPGYFISRT